MDGDVPAGIQKCLPRFVPILRLPAEFAGGSCAPDRVLGHVAIPEGVEVVETGWLQNSGVESVEVPASVRELGADAFRGCGGLRCVTFAEDSRLRTIGERCFQGSGIREVSVPKRAETIGRDAFRYCSGLG